MNESVHEKLLNAACCGDVVALQQALDAGADLRARGHYDWTALHWASAYGRTRCARILVETGAELEARDHAGCTALHAAASSEQSECVRMLIELGAELDRTKILGTTLYDYAKTQGWKSVLAAIERRTLTQNTKDRNLEGSELGIGL